MQFQRGSGILLHVRSLPSRFAIGDLGPRAYQFVDRLAEGGQKYWQILPLNQTGYGDSPYLCLSAFAGNVYLISPQKLAEFGIRAVNNIEPPKSGDPNTVDFGAAVEYKISLLNTAFDTFRNTQDQGLIDDFHKFCDENVLWLDDYALFRALRAANGHTWWSQCPEPFRSRESAAIEQARGEHDDAIFSEKFRQYIFSKQWFELKA